MGEVFPLEVEDFCAWLCEREHHIVGVAGACFSSPLAHWLSERIGRVCGVEDQRFGLARLDTQLWWWLPQWAQRFLLLLERYGLREVTGSEAFVVLAEVEHRSRYMSHPVEGNGVGSCVREKLCGGIGSISG